ADDHPTNWSKTDRPPDTEHHVSAHFSNQRERNLRIGRTVHIYVDIATGGLRRQDVKWHNPYPDDEKMEQVYSNRTAWPPGVTASAAPWAPGHAPFTPPSTQAMVEAPIPSKNPWGQ
ncbi:hypothetical protein FQN49_008865, partial [Arthroderma sp. PD_2]